jgi:hypothetical protein
MSDWSEFVRQHAPRAPSPPPGHVERVVAGMRAHDARRRRHRQLLQLGAAAAAVAAALLLQTVARHESRHDTARFLAESFTSVDEDATEDASYDAWLP